MMTQGRKIGSVLRSLLAEEKPVVESKEKTILLNVRITASLLAAFKKQCILNDKNMTDIVTDFIYDQLKNFEKLEEIESKYTGTTTPWNFRISEKLRDDFHRVCKEHGTKAGVQITQFILRTVENA